MTVERIPMVAEDFVPEGSHSVNRNLQELDGTVKKIAQNPKAAAHSPIDVVVPQVVNSTKLPHPPVVNQKNSNLNTKDGPGSNDPLDSRDFQRSKETTFCVLETQNLEAFSNRVDRPGVLMIPLAIGSETSKKGSKVDYGPSEPPCFEVKAQKSLKHNGKKE
ncbi:hypothetical protein REPUB_Repub13aG0002000 [Reevesia pubescens]